MFCGVWSSICDAGSTCTEHRANVSHLSGTHSCPHTQYGYTCMIVSGQVCSHLGIRPVTFASEVRNVKERCAFTITTISPGCTIIASVEPHLPILCVQGRYGHYSYIDTFHPACFSMFDLQRYLFS